MNKSDSVAMRHRFKKRFVALELALRPLPVLLLLALSGCATQPSQRPDQAEKLSGSALQAPLPKVLADEGLKKLAERNYEDASRIFNAGLKFAPSNTGLHFLNGLTYHLQYLDGNESAKDLAVTGYELALTEDPAFFDAALQLGRLQLHAKRYPASITAFERAVAIKPKSADAHLGMAVAAYYQRDLTRAGVAAERAATLLPNDIETTRAVALIKAANGDNQAASVALARYANLEKNEVRRTRLESRVADWRSWHEMNSKIPEGTQLNGERMAQAGVQSLGEVSSTPAPANASVTGDTASLESEKPWYACPDSIQLASSPAGSQDPPVMTRISTPCIGVPQRMAVFDVAIIRTDDTQSTSFGTNLLDTLNFTFGIGKLVVNNATSGDSPAQSQTTQNSRGYSVGVGGVSVGALPSTSYSLNIANSTGNRAEVLARPSLVALDGMPSTFFSGRNVTVGLTGGNSGGASFSDKPVGISMSVTPTFVGDDRLLLAVRAERAFIETIDANVAFGQQLQTSRNLVSANVSLKMGQTLILSGLSERQTQRNFNGVPVLKDIPILRYLFNQKTTLDFTSSVLILVTPRPAAYDQDLMQGGLKHIANMSDANKREIGLLIEKQMKKNPESIPENMTWTYARVLGNQLYLNFRTGDLAIESWSAPSSWDAFLKDIKTVLYY